MTSTDLYLYLYLDIETAPTHDTRLVDELFEKHRVAPLDLTGITAAANLKDEIKIAEDLAKRRAKAIADHDAARAKASADFEEAFRKSCLDATTGHIACVSVALGDGDIFHVENAAFHQYAYLGGRAEDPDLVPLDQVVEVERLMLQGLFTGIEKMLQRHALARAEADWVRHEPREIKEGHWQLTIPGTGQKYSRFISGKDAFLKESMSLQAPVVVAHHAQFDLRYIWQRAIILGVAVPDWWPHDAKPWDTARVDDTMTAWAGATGRIGLDRLCRALGIEGKGDIDGSKVWDAIREGRLADVTDYCDGDVERLRAVHRRIRQQTVETTTVEVWSNRNGRAEIVASHVEGAV